MTGHDPTEVDGERQAATTDAINRALRALEEGRTADLTREAIGAESLVPRADAALLFRVGSVLQAAFRFTGDPALFRLARDTCILVANRTEFPALAIPARALAGNIYMLAGQYHRALEHCDAAIALAAASGLSQDRVVAMGHQFRAYVLFEWNQLAAARAGLEFAWSLTRDSLARDGDRGVRSGVARVMAEVCLAANQRDDAARWLTELGAVVREPMTLRNREWMAAVRARHGFATTRDLAELDGWRRRYDYRDTTLAQLSDLEIASRLHEVEHLLAMLEASSQWEALAAVAAVLARGSAPLRGWYRVRAASTHAVALEARGRHGEALASWRDALAMGEEGGFVRVYLDGSPIRVRLLHRALKDRGGRAHAERVLSAARVDHDVAGLAALTPRQFEILQLVAAGHADRELAEATGLSVATVKTHLRAIYGRLGVRSRTAAVARARERGVV